jgi:RNA polymerase sigma factor (TIGR02999 family)
VKSSRFSLRASPRQSATASNSVADECPIPVVFSRYFQCVFRASTDMSDVTQILAAIDRGEATVTEQLLPAVYQEMRRLAEQMMARETPGQTLQPTALVHEVYLRLVADPEQRWQCRGHFFAAAAEAMRRILVENARSKKRLKRGGDWHRVGLDQAERDTQTSPVDLIALDDALNRLAELDSVKAEVVKLRYFAGLNNDETANALGISLATVKRHWTYAKTWLRRELSGGEHE